MVHLVLGVLLLFMLQTLLPALLQYLGGRAPLGSKLLLALGPRDVPPPRTANAERAYKALNNMFEALPVFLTLAILSLLLNVEREATWGATIFLVARVLYVPAYISGIPGIRSLVWGVGLFGLLAMAQVVLAAAGS